MTKLLDKTVQNLKKRSEGIADMSEIEDDIEEEEYLMPDDESFKEPSYRRPPRD
jgi:hypothetical protein